MCEHKYAAALNHNVGAEAVKERWGAREPPVAEIGKRALRRHHDV